MADFLDLLVFEVGSYRHVSDEAIGRKSVRWLFAMYEHVQRRKYNEMVFQIVAVEHGIERAFTREDQKPDFPTYDEMLQKEVTQQETEPKKPAWMVKYEEVNRDKMLNKPGEK